MQTKTRLIALLLGLVLVFCLSACQKAPAETTDAPAETADFVLFFAVFLKLLSSDSQPNKYKEKAPAGELPGLSRGV